jgi:hypothetical protein
MFTFVAPLALLAVAQAITAALPTPENEALVSRLLGGGTDFAPYEVPCPEGLTFIRSSDVGLIQLRGSGGGHMIVEYLVELCERHCWA